MILHGSYLIPAILLLWLPMPLPARMRLTARSRESTVTLKDLVCTWQNWGDLVRAGLATFVLLELAVSIDPALHQGGSSVMLLQWFIIAGGVLLQTIRFRRAIFFIAPVFYLCGLTLSLSGFLEGAFALFVGWLFSIAGKKLAYQLPVMAVALGIAGYTLSGFNLSILFNCAVIFLPLVLSLLFEIDLLYMNNSSNRPNSILRERANEIRPA